MRQRHTSTMLMKNTSTMLEYYRIFAKQIKLLPPEPELSDFYRTSENQENGELLFVVVGTSIATYALYKYLKQMTDKGKLYQAYYEPHCLWTVGKAIKELHKITSMSKKDIKSWLAKQALWQVHIPPPKEVHHPHYDVTKPNEQHRFDLLCMPHNLFEGNIYKYILTGIHLHQDIKFPGPLGQKNQAKLYLSWNQSIKRVVCLSTQRRFNAIMVLSLKMKLQSCLKNTALRFEKQQQNISTHIRLLWKPLTKSWQNCCLNRWMCRSFKTLKKFLRFGLKI